MAGDIPMAWLRFVADHDHRAGGRTIGFLKGMRCLVTRLCADEAVALERAQEIPAPDRATADRLAQDPYAADLPPTPPPAAPAPPAPASPPPQPLKPQTPASDAPAAAPAPSAQPG